MIRAPDLDRLVRLRALREDRAARAVADAARQTDTARALRRAAGAALDDHDAGQAALDAGFAAGDVVSQRDLGLSRDRVLQADLRRDDLVRAVDLAATTVATAEAEMHARRSAWHKARAGREALATLAARHARRRSATSEGEAW